MDKGNPKLAIRYAKRIIEDGKGRTPTEIAPGTKVYGLVEELVKYLPEDVGLNFYREMGGDGRIKWIGFNLWVFQMKN